MGLERDGVAILEIDQQPPLEHQEELVLIIVVMPVKVTLNHPESDHRLVDRRQRLVEPGLVGGDLRRDVDERQAAVLVVEMDVVLLAAHALSSLALLTARRRALNAVSPLRCLTTSRCNRPT
jgi:hypothetical protein